MASRPQDQDRNQEATVYLGNLDEKCTDAMIWELMMQAGPVSNVHLPKDRISQSHQGFGFCEFMTEEDADYACKIMNQIKLWGKPIRVNKASYDKKQLDVGANLFIGNLDSTVDETLLYNTFSTFGPVSQTAKIARDPQTGESKGYGFVSYNDFEASDAALEQMNGQYLMNKAITVQYAFKKEGKGERHGTAAERLLAAQAKKHQMLPVPGPAGQFRPPQPAGTPGQYPPPGGFQGQYTPQQGVQNGYPQPPPGMPVYQPQQGGYPAPPAGFPQGALMGYPPIPPSGFPQQQQQQQPIMPYGNQGFVPPPPMGFAPQGQPQYGMPQQQQQQQQFGNMVPPPPPGFGMQMGMNMGMGMGMGMGMPLQNGMQPPPPPGFGMQQQQQAAR